jgi:hypothetical protein
MFLTLLLLVFFCIALVADVIVRVFQSRRPAAQVPQD